MIILSIESSCDDSCITIYDSNLKKIKFNYIYNQKKIHYKYKGIIPKIASYIHYKYIYKIILVSIKKINIKYINLISYTNYPGLRYSLLIGVSFAKFLSFSTNIKSIAINHLKAHTIITYIYNNIIFFNNISLIISGINTLIIKIINYNNIITIIRNNYNNIGYLFDKIFYLTKIINKNIKINKNIYHNLILTKNILKNKFNFNLGEILINTHKKIMIKKIIIIYNFKILIVKILTNKIKKIMIKKEINNFIIGGGVIRNINIRNEITKICDSININSYIPKNIYCTDNSLMISLNGFVKINNYLYNNNNLFLNLFKKKL